MWWYGYGWWWWWILFLVIFFFLPLLYGWGYRGWGPWYRRRRPPRDLTPPETARDRTSPIEEDSGWGWLGIVLWFVLIMAVLWLIAAWGWGTG